MIQRAHVSKKSPQKLIRSKKRGETTTYSIEETDRSKLKSSPQWSLVQSHIIFNQTNKGSELLERSQRTLRKWFL